MVEGLCVGYTWGRLRASLLDFINRLHLVIGEGFVNLLYTLAFLYFAFSGLRTRVLRT